MKILYSKFTKDKNINKILHKLWCIKVTLITICLAGLFSFVSNVISSFSSIIAMVFLLLLLIVLSIIFDGIDIAVTSANKTNFINFTKNEKSLATKVGCKLIDNQEIVANISADVIGDIFSIISGSCSVSIVVQLVKTYPTISKQILIIVLSSLIAGLTVGGKAFLKRTAIKNCDNYLLLVSKIICVFIRRNNVFRKNTKS